MCGKISKLMVKYPLRVFASPAPNRKYHILACHSSNSELMNKSLSKQNSSGKNNSEFTIQGWGQEQSEKSNLTVLDVPGLLRTMLCTWQDLNRS